MSVKSLYHMFVCERDIQKSLHRIVTSKQLFVLMYVSLIGSCRVNLYFDPTNPYSSYNQLIFNLIFSQFVNTMIGERLYHIFVCVRDIQKSLRAMLTSE